MRYFVDTEFVNAGHGQPITLISIGVVTEEGREFYFENKAVSLDALDPWLQENVVPHLLRSSDPRSLRTLCHSGLPGWIALRLHDFITLTQQGTTPEFWGFYCHFDFVLMQQLFGDFSGWPEGWPLYCHDLRQWLDDHGLQDVKQPDDAPHNALDDARWIAQTFRRLCAEVEVAR